MTACADRRRHTGRGGAYLLLPAPRIPHHPDNPDIPADHREYGSRITMISLDHQQSSASTTDVRLGDECCRTTPQCPGCKTASWSNCGSRWSTPPEPVGSVASWCPSRSTT